MKKSLTAYLATLSNSDDTIFEEILSKKYRKFTKLFCLVKDYSEYITKMNYEATDSETLSVTITFTKNVKMDIPSQLISSWRSLGYEIEATLKGKKMTVRIRYPEE